MSSVYSGFNVQDFTVHIMVCFRYQEKKPFLNFNSCLEALLVYGNASLMKTTDFGAEKRLCENNFTICNVVL